MDYGSRCMDTTTQAPNVDNVRMLCVCYYSKRRDPWERLGERATGVNHLHECLRTMSQKAISAHRNKPIQCTIYVLYSSKKHRKFMCKVDEPELPCFSPTKVYLFMYICDLRNLMHSRNVCMYVCFFLLVCFIWNCFICCCPCKVNEPTYPFNLFSEIHTCNNR